MKAGTVAPVIAPGKDDEVTILSSPNTSNRPDSDYTPVSAEITKYLVAD